jgi:hypothetical protein
VISGIGMASARAMLSLVLPDILSIDSLVDISTLYRTGLYLMQPHANRNQAWDK